MYLLDHDAATKFLKTISSQLGQRPDPATTYNHTLFSQFRSPMGLLILCFMLDLDQKSQALVLEVEEGNWDVSRWCVTRALCSWQQDTDQLILLSILSGHLNLRTNTNYQWWVHIINIVYFECVYTNVLFLEIVYLWTLPKLPYMHWYNNKT